MSMIKRGDVQHKDDSVMSVKRRIISPNQNCVKEAKQTEEEQDQEGIKTTAREVNGSEDVSSMESLKSEEDKGMGVR